MNTTDILSDWRKQGREKLAAMTATSDEDIEKAFADQASGFAENAIGPLMQDQYRIGFETVKANADNTRICGMFAFRIDKELIFAPVFFINGTIKGPILYRSDRKTFVPANKEWASYLIENIELHDGKGVSREQSGKSAPLVHMQRLLMAPNGGVKAASADSEMEQDIGTGLDRAENGIRTTLIDRHAVKDIEREMRGEGLAGTMGKDDFKKELKRRYKKKHGKKTRDLVQRLKSASCRCQGDACCVDCITGKCCKDSAFLEAKNPEDVETGEFVVKDFNEKYCVPGRTSDGHITVKFAAWDDGTIRIGDYPITVADGEKIEKEAAFTLTVPGVVELEIPAEGSKMLKEAFFKDIPNNSDTWIRAMHEGTQCLREPQHLMRDLVQDEEFGKAAATAIVEASRGDEGFNFADSVATCYDSPEDLFGYIGGMRKAAADDTKKPEDLVLVFDAKEAPKENGEIPERYWKDGFLMVDRRPQDDLALVWERNDSQISYPEGLGVYSVLQENGEFLHDTLIGRPAKVDAGYGHYVGWMQDEDMEELGGSLGERHDSNHYIIIHDGQARLSHGCLCKRTGGPSSYKHAVDRPQAKKLYMIIVPGSDSILGPIAVDDVKTVDGVTFASVWGIKHSSIRFGHARAVWDDEALEVSTNAENLSDITVNPDVDETDIQNGVFGKGTLFIPLNRAVDKEIKAFGTTWHESAEILQVQLGNAATVDKWMYGQFGVRKAKLKKEVMETPGGEKRACYSLETEGKSGRKLCKLKMMIKLAYDLAMPASTAYKLVDEADAAEDGVHFCVEGNEMNKQASRYQVVDAPSFNEEFDSDFGVPVQPVQTFNLRVGGLQTMPLPAAIGEKRMPTPTGLPDTTVATSSPEELRSLADTYNLPNVFEHGVVGTLANTFDAMRLVDKYLPLIEQGVDALGRIKFLLHWCPTDFERAYGSDDMTNFEAENDSTFNALGSLFLKLVKQNERQKQDESKLMGDEIIE